MQNGRELLLSACFFRRAQARFSHFPEGNKSGLAFNSLGKLSWALPGKPVLDSRNSSTRHQFGGVTAAAAMNLEANVMLPRLLSNKNTFLTWCLRSANNTNKSIMCKAVNKAAHYSDRENQQHEKAVPYVTTEITCTPYLLPCGCTAI